MTQQLGNGGMFMQGMGMMGQAAMGSFDAMRQNVSNMFSVDPQKVTQVQQQRAGRGGGGMGNVNITGDYVGPEPTSGMGGSGGPPVTQGQGGNSGGGGKGRGGGGGGGKTPAGGGRSPVGGMNFSRGNMLGGATNLVGMGLPVMQAVGNFQEGKNLEGAGNLAGGAAALAATRGMNPLLRVGAAAVSSVVAGGLGAAGDRQVAEKTGRGAAEYNQETQRYQTGQNLNTMIAGINDIQETQLKNDILRMKAQEPILNRMLNQQLVRQQAMNASLTNSYAMLGTLATASKMAQQGQREAGANFRTALTANPYANSAVAAPSISF